MKIIDQLKKVNLIQFVPAIFVISLVGNSVFGYTAPKAEKSKNNSENQVEAATTQAKKKTKKANAGDIDLSKIKDGTYEGQANGYRGLVKVSVTVKDHKITAIKVLSNSDDAAFFNRASAGVIKNILAKVGLAPEHAGRYPHQFSGGQRQRVGIARALIMNPKLIIADECISALDVSIQAQVVNLMKDIQQETGTAYLFIAHDLSMVKYISDRIGVLHLGHLLETGTTEEIFENPIHPYTKSLLSAIPAPNPVVEKNRVALSYDYKTSGIDYNKGTDHLVSGTHYVKCTDEEFKKWTE